jgi:hypothetical protein
VVVFLAALVLASPAALAYDNVGAHRAINAAALVGFINDRMPSDPDLKHAQLDLYAARYGFAWDPVDGPDTNFTFKYTQNISVYRSKPLGLWLIDGGFSGDDPERDGYYGCAWRSVGETMHIVSDLTVPAHVRNDGHALSEPLEQATGVPAVLRYALGTPARLDYGTAPGTRSLRNIMVSVALWTNTNFFSSDTILRADGSQGNGEKNYSLPMVFSGPKDGYFYTLYDSKEIKAYNRTLTSFCGLTSESFAVSGDAITAQQQRLIPTAIRASEAVLDAFLPRFTVTVDGVQASATASTPGCVVNAHIEHKPTGEWPANSFPDGSIRNGAYIRVYHASGTTNDYSVPLSANTPATGLNRISTVVPAQPGDRFVVYYNFGGYRVFSDSYTIEMQSPTITPVPPGYVPDLIGLGPDQTAGIGERFGISVYYDTKYVWQSDEDHRTITGTVSWDTDGVPGREQDRQP